MSDPELSELDALKRSGILTEHEHADAVERVRARTGPDVPALGVADSPPRSGPRHAGPGRGRHAKHSRRWPWVLALVVAIGLSVVVGLALRPAGAHKTRDVGVPRPSGLPSSALPSAGAGGPSKAIIVASPADTAMLINLDGADARIAVSRLTATAGAAGQQTLSATVTAQGISGRFPLDPTQFTASSGSGHTYSVASITATTLRAVSVFPGQRVQGVICFTVPVGEHVAVVLFTSRLGEQLGLWSSS